MIKFSFFDFPEGGVVLFFDDLRDFFPEVRTVENGDIEGFP